MNLVLQTLADGLVLGGIYALAAVGFSLIFGVLHVINLSHGILVLMGAYLALILSEALHIDPLLCIPPVMAVLFVRRLRLPALPDPACRRRSPLGSMLLTFGVALMLQNVMIWVFSPDMKNITPSYAFTSFRLGPIDLRRGARQLPGRQPGPAELPRRAAQLLAARPRDPRHRPADHGGAAVRRERAPCLCADLRGVGGLRRRGRHRDRHHPALLAPGRGRPGR